MSDSKKNRSPIFFGWWIVLTTGTITGLGMGFNQYGLSVFFKDLAAELGVSRAITSLAAGIGRLEGGITGPLSGWLSDKFGARWPIIIGICMAGTGLIWMNFITEVWHYYVVWGVLTGMGLNLGLTVPCDKTIINWFVGKRGLAQGIKFTLIGVYGIVVLQIVTPLVLSLGWRITCLIWGMVMLVTMPLVFAFIKRERPEYYGLLPDGAKIGQDTKEAKNDMIDMGVGYATGFQETEYSFRQTIRNVTYWLIVTAFSLHSLIVSGITIHVIPFLTDIGINQTTASNMMGLMVFFTIPSRFLGGIIADRVRKNRLQFLLAGAIFLHVIGIGTFLTYQNIASVYFLLVCFGLSSGAGTPLLLLILGRYFGRKAFGSILGTVVACIAPTGLVAPVYTGWIYDTTGSYITAFITFAALAMFSTLILCLAHAPR